MDLNTSSFINNTEMDEIEKQLYFVDHYNQKEQKQTEDQNQEQIVEREENERNETNQQQI